MTKHTITRMWIAGVVVMAAGLVMGGVSLALMLSYGGHFVAAPTGNGYDYQPSLNGFFWTTVVLMVAGFSIAAIGGIVQLAAWIGALVNTYQLADKTWFIILLVGGLLAPTFGLTGFAAMVAYLIAGPDGLAAGPRQIPPDLRPAIPSPVG